MINILIYIFEKNINILIECIRTENEKWVVKKRKKKKKNFLLQKLV